MKKAEPLSKVLKVLLSLWAAYNILAMVVMPNVSSYFGLWVSGVVTPYANTIGLNASWNFFSPDPAHTMYLRYYVHFIGEDGIETQDPIEDYFPQEKNKGISDPTRKRELYAMRFMVIEPVRLKTLFGPWICKKFPEATYVEMEHVVETVPPLDQVVTLKNERVHDLSEEIQYVRSSYNCSGDNDEVVQ